MEGKILGVDAAHKTAVITTTTGERIPFDLHQWKGQLELVTGMDIDYDLDASTGQAINVYPSITTAQHAKNSQKSKVKLILFAFLIGGFGVHKFYVGSWGWGVVYMLISLTYIPLIISLVEMIRYITLTETEINERIQKLDGPFSFLW